MKKYNVHVCEIAAVYEIEAESEEQAKMEARELYKREENTWIEPCHVGIGNV